MQPAQNVRRALQALRERYRVLAVSHVYESEAIGFDGDNFLNLVVTAETEANLADIKADLMELENAMGRDRSRPRFSERKIDIDILTYGDSDGSEAGLTLPREEVTRNAYVLRPLSEVLPASVHAPSGKTYAQLWADYDKSRQPLWPVEFDWQATD